MLRRWDEVIDIGFRLREAGISYIMIISPKCFILKDENKKNIHKVTDLFVGTLQAFTQGYCESGKIVSVQEVINNAFKRKQIEFNSNTVSLVRDLMIASSVETTRVDALSIRQKQITDVLRRYL